MKKTIAILFIFFCYGIVAAQNYPTSDKELMLQILKERQDNFSAYTKSLDASTGIFGLKTKKDIQHSNAILMDIVRLDNRLIAVLNRQLSYKDFEKTTMNYRSLDDQKAMDLLHQNITFSENKIKELDAKLLAEQKQINIRNFVIGFLIFILFGLFYRRRKSQI